MRYVPALLLDAVFVLVFAVIGRASHDENPAGFLITAWPFLVALVVGHLIAALLPGRPRRPWALAWGAVVWVVTVAGGMLLRIASGDTAQVAFVIVATITLGVFLIGWRSAAALMRRRRAGRSAVSADPAADTAPVALGDRGTDADRALDDEHATEAERDPGSASEPEQR